MECIDYILITTPFLVCYFFLILNNAKLLQTHRYIFTIGFFLTLWHVYEFVISPLSIPLLFPVVMKSLEINIYIATLLFILFYLLFLNVFLRIFFKSRLLKTFSYRIFLLFKKEHKFLRILKILLFLSFCGYLCYYYNTYKSINTFSILTHKFELNFQAFIGYQVYLLVILYSVFLWSSFSWIYTLLVRKKNFYSILVLAIVIFVLIGLKSKYCLVTVIFYITGLFFFKSKKFATLILFCFISICPILIGFFNILRGGYFLNLTNLSLKLLFKYSIQRADFLWGFYKLIYYQSQTLDFGLGYTILSLFFRIFPRIIWPDRPGSSSVILTQKVFGHFETLQGWSFDFGGIGEFFYNFGPIGIILAAIYGAFWISLFNDILIKAINYKKPVLLSFVVTSPVFWIPWNIGVNTLFSMHLIPHIFILLVVWLLSI